jgi:hypothetical protein
MTAKRRHRGTKYFTVAEANATLPLVRAIVRDISGLARDLEERRERLSRVHQPERGGLADAYHEEVQQVQAEFERDHERMRHYVRELSDLGVLLKDALTGLVDFPCRMNNREVFLCWRQGEPSVSHWHELDAGFMGRQKLMVDTAHHGG